jgi:hypothetical protein
LVETGALASPWEPNDAAERHGKDRLATDEARGY